MRKGKLSKDIWFVSGEVSLDCCISESEMKRNVYLIGKKGDECIWNEESGEWDWDGGSFEEGNEFVEEVK